MSVKEGDLGDVSPFFADDGPMSNDEVIRSAQEALNEIAELGKDLTPEELLEDVMNFERDTEKANAEGQGFVSGAFEKAKELLRERSQQREARVSDSFGVGLKEPEVTGPSSVEEELRRMFEAGERHADSRIVKAQSPGSMASAGGLSEKDDAIIDELIAAEKSISGHARVLDDELAELELLINKSPGEETDGPAKAPLFDIFSGPEVYNPNVDPETATNWPGALPGTKRVRLPVELEEAVKQASFAADVLSKMIEETSDGVSVFRVGSRTLTEEQVCNMRGVVEEAVEVGLIPDPVEIMAERSRLQMVIDELWDQPEERVREILSNYKDLLLSDNFVSLIKERMSAMADRDLDALRRDDNSLDEPHRRERELLSNLVGFAQLLLKEVQALGAELEASQLEVIRSICKVAMDPRHQTEEETAQALSDAVRDMRPLLDESLVAYLKYAIAEEEGSLARRGVLDDPEHNQWLFVLKIIQQGVYQELSRSISRYVDHIWYVLRMETPQERRELLKSLIDAMPTLDVRPFVQVVQNIVGSLGDIAVGEFDDAGDTLASLTNRVLQLSRDVKDLLPPDRVALMAKDADEWATSKREKLMEARKVTQQRLEAARDTEHLDGEIDALGRRGEIERIE